MSTVIDGKDILNYYSSLSIAMRESLSDLLNGQEKPIPSIMLHGAQNLFSIAMDYVRERTGKPIVHTDWLEQRESTTSYILVVDMLKKVKKGIKENEINSELEKLTKALAVLTPDGRQIKKSRDKYETLRDIFGEMFNKSQGYNSTFEERSPYCIGTFENGDGFL